MKHIKVNEISFVSDDEGNSISTKEIIINSDEISYIKRVIPSDPDYSMYSVQASVALTVVNFKKTTPLSHFLIKEDLNEILEKINH